MKFFLCFAVFVPIIAGLRWFFGWLFLPWWVCLAPVALWFLVCVIVGIVYIFFMSEEDEDWGSM